MDLQQFHDMELRCTQEDMPRCQAACPLHVDVRGMLALVRKGDFSQAYARYAQTVPFPRILARVCDHPCEKACLRSSKDDGIAIRALELACVTYNRRNLPNRPLRTQKSATVAIVGAGISGLAAASTLAAKGYKVTVYDAGARPGGRLVAFPCPYAGLDIELVRGVGQRNTDLFVRHQTFCPGYRPVIQIMQDFQSVHCLSADGSKGRRDVQAYHPCPGNPHAHAVFKYVAADFDIDTEIRRHPPFFFRAGAFLLQYFHGFRHGQSHSDRLCAAEGRFHFLPDEFYDFRLPFSHCLSYLW